MFDFDELEDAEVPDPAPQKAQDNSKPEQAADEVPEAKPEHAEAEVDSSKPEQAAEEAQELPNAKYSVGMFLESIGPVLMRAEEDMESAQVARLAKDSLVQVLEVGIGASGKRVRLRASGGEEGWASVIAQNSAPMFRATQRSFMPKAEMPWSSIQPGDICLCKTTVLMRKEEDVESEQVRRLQMGEELEILELGTEPTGRRFKAKDSQGKKGWISAFSKDGSTLLEVTQRGSHSLFAGAGQALGGGDDRDSRELRAAALAAAEKRQAMFMSRGVGDKKKFEDREQREREQREREQREREEREKRELKPKLENRLPAVPAVRTRLGVEKQKEEVARAQGLTAKEVEEVFDLENLGFDFYQALHAFAAHRDKEVAANILLESQEEPALQPVNVPLRPLPAAFPGSPLNESLIGLTSSDLQKVQRLMNLGFDRPTAVKALFHCNRDEEMAGNRLLA